MSISMDCSPPAALSMGFSRQEYWTGLPCYSQGILLTQGSNPHFLCLLHWQVGSLPLAPPGKPMVHIYNIPLQYMYTVEFYSAIKEEWYHAICSNMDGPTGYHTKGSKSDKVRPAHGITFMSQPKNEKDALIYKTETDSQIGKQMCGAVQSSSVQFSPVTQSCPTLRDPMNQSTPGLPVHHQLPEFTQTHVH